MLGYGSKEPIKILVSKALYKILSSLAYIIAIEELFSESSGNRNKERDFWQTFLGILDPMIPHFVDSGPYGIKWGHKGKCGNICDILDHTRP